MKSLFLILAAGLILASCTDKKAADEIAKLKADMMKADSICKADNTVLLDSIGKMQMMMDSMMAMMPAPKNSTSSKSSSSGKTTTTTTPTNDKGIMDTKGKSSESVDMKSKGKTSEPVDMKTKGKTSKSGGGK